MIEMQIRGMRREILRAPFWQALALILFAVIIFKNLCFFQNHLRQLVSYYPDRMADAAREQAFLPLLSSLKTVPVAGFYSDRYDAAFWTTSPAKRDYQHAQRALAPTLLDAEEPFRHDYVIFECARPGCDVALVKAHHLTEVRRLSSRVILTRRDRGQP